MSDLKSSTAIPAFDGFRGFLAIWVLLSHATQFVDGPRGIIDRGGIAVDLFMFVSGFLMYWNIENRADRESPRALTTWGKFFTRRFFRIAPLYFAALALSMYFEGVLKTGLRDIYINQGLTFVRPFESCSRDMLRNIFLHITFLFGLSPCYAASNVIPDWSLSLEMQFYALFPLLYFVLKKAPAVLSAIFAAICVALAYQFISVYVVDSSKFISYPQPSLLVLRINCFMAGMILAKIVCSEKIGKIDLLAFLLSALVFQRLTFSVIAIVMAIVIFRDVLFVHPRLMSAKRLFDIIAFPFEAKFSRQFGDLSYGIYLIHIFLLIPVVGWLQSTAWFFGLDRTSRFILVVFIVLPVVVLLAKVTFFVVERPSVEVGRKLSRRF